MWKGLHLAVDNVVAVVLVVLVSCDGFFRLVSSPSFRDRLFSLVLKIVVSCSLANDDRGWYMYAHLLRDDDDGNLCRRTLSVHKITSR